MWHYSNDKDTICHVDATTSGQHELSPWISAFTDILDWALVSLEHLCVLSGIHLIEELSCESWEHTRIYKWGDAATVVYHCMWIEKAQPAFHSIIVVHVQEKKNQTDLKTNLALLVKFCLFWYPLTICVRISVSVRMLLRLKLVDDEHCSPGSDEAGLHQVCADSESHWNASKTCGPSNSRCQRSRALPTKTKENTTGGTLLRTAQKCWVTNTHTPTDGFKAKDSPISGPLSPGHDATRT